MYKQKEIEDLLGRLWIFSSEEKSNILKKYASATKKSLNGLVDILKGALKKQEEFIGKMVQADPKFGERTTAFLRDRVQAMQGDIVATEHKQMKDLEKHFDS